MIVKNLSHTSLDKILDCFLLAFENYYVPMPTDLGYYKTRWKAAKVDFSLSYGMFEDEKLVGFILNAVDTRKGKLTAFNTGTGVLPEHRGKRIVKSIYDFALPDMIQNGILNYSLEVITKNDVAIRSYEGIGFKICKDYKCFKGKIQLEISNQLDLKEIQFDDIDWSTIPNQEMYSWDNQQETIREDNYIFFQVINKGVPESFFVMKENGYISQFELLTNKNEGAWNRLFSGIQSVSEEIRINNVDSRLTDKIDFLNSIGIENHVDQFEMELINRTDTV